MQLLLSAGLIGLIVLWGLLSPESMSNVSASALAHRTEAMPTVATNNPALGWGFNRILLGS